MKARVLSAMTIASLLAIAACAPPPPPTTGTSDDEAALRAIGAKYAEAWNKGDVAAIMALTADDNESVGADGVVVKGKAASEAKEKEAAAARAGMNMKLNVQTSYVNFAGSDKAAAVGGTWTLEGVPAGMGANKGAWMVVAMKGADGQWRTRNGLVAEYAPPPPPAGAPPPPPQAKDKPKGK